MQNTLSGRAVSAPKTHPRPSNGQGGVSQTGIEDAESRGYWRIIAAGGPVSANTLHAATVGAVAAIADADRINDRHWAAANAGERGYRRPDRRKRNGNGDVAATTPKPYQLRDLPPDLTVPAFLDRRRRP